MARTTRTQLRLRRECRTRSRRRFVAAATAGLVLLTSAVATADQAQGDVADGGGSTSATEDESFSTTFDLYLRRTGSAATSVSWAQHSTAGSCSGISAGTISNNPMVLPTDTIPPWATAANTSLSKNSPWNTKSTVTISGTAGAADSSCSFTFRGTDSALTGANRDVTFTINFVAPDGPNCDAVAAPEDPTFLHTPDGDSDWYVTVPTVSASSDVDATVTYSTTTDGPYGAAAPTLSEGETTVYAIATGPAPCEKLSNESSQTYKVDTSAPDVTLQGGPEDGQSYYFGFVPAAPTCSATDPVPGSGLTGSCVVTDYGTTVGSHTVVGKQSDVAGNEGSASVSYSVLAWTVAGTGFKSPVTSDLSKVNVINAGRTVPLKFNVFAGPTEITDVSLLGATWSWQSKACDVGDTPVEVDVSGNAGSTTLRYENGELVRNWQTPKTKGCGILTLTLADGTKIQADFRLR